MRRPSAKHLPSLRSRFFRVHAIVAGVCVIIIFIGVMAVDFYNARQQMITDLTSTVANISTLYAQEAPMEHAKLDDFLNGFGIYSGLHIICIYSSEGSLEGSWRQSMEHEPCPPLLVKSGTVADFLQVSFAREIIRKDHYFGMVYAEALLLSFNTRLAQGLGLLVGLLAIATAACVSAAHFSSSYVTRPLSAIRGQIECLKENDPTSCPLIPHSATRETNALANSIAELRSHLVTSTIDRQQYDVMRHWHWEVLSGCVDGIRKRLGDENGLRDHLTNYTLLLETERDEISPPAIPFHLITLMDESLTYARRAQTPAPTVNLTVSINPTTPKQWLGQPEILGSLLRHLLQIGLKRTHRGFVSLRLETLDDQSESPTFLRVLYEDSGPLLQQWQLHYWLSAARDEAPPSGLPYDISWLLIARLIRRLCGTITCEAGRQDGFLLEILLPMSVATSLSLVTDKIAVTVPPSSTPLLLIAEEDKDNRKLIVDLLSGVDCKFLLVETSAQAAELAPLFPFSAILIHLGIGSHGEDKVRRLHYLMESGTMPHVPLWATLTPITASDIIYWQARGVDQLLSLPLRTDILTRCCAELPLPDSLFYHRYEAYVRQDLPAEILAVMPQMNHMLAQQIAMIEPLIATFSQGKAPLSVLHQAHAVKSAALALGYFRLAAFMEQIEHSQHSRIFAAYARNWDVIADMLKSSGFDQSTPLS